MRKSAAANAGAVGTVVNFVTPRAGPLLLYLLLPITLARYSDRLILSGQSYTKSN